MNRIDEIEYKISSGEMNAHQVFTQMLQLIDSGCDRNYRDGFRSGYSAGQFNDEEKLKKVSSR